MTTAICVGCGRFKVGALTVCVSCQLDPTTDPSVVARSLLMSDHYRTAEQLKTASAALAAGEAIAYDADDLARITTELAKQPPGHLRPPLVCQVIVWSLIALMVVLAGLVVWLWFVL
jgi:hypothetical protein